MQQTGIIDFEREEELTIEEKEKVINAFNNEKKIEGLISCFADGNFVQFNIETKNPERQVIKFTMDFGSLVALCSDLGFNPELSNEEPSEEEKKQIQEDLKDDRYKKYLEESREDLI